MPMRADFADRIHRIERMPLSLAAVFEFFGSARALDSAMRMHGATGKLVPVDRIACEENRRTLLDYGQEESVVRAYVYACTDRIVAMYRNECTDERAVDRYTRKEIVRLMEEVWFPRLGV